MEGTLPPGRFTNVMLWNVHMQTLDYTSRQSSLNAAQMQIDADDLPRFAELLGVHDRYRPAVIAGDVMADADRRQPAEPHRSRTTCSLVLHRRKAPAACSAPYR